MKYLLLLLLVQPVCAMADIESDFLSARNAMRDGNKSRLDTLAERLNDTLLEPYVTYYQLRMRMSTKATVAIKAFLARTSESPVVDQFRGEWLKYLGKHQSWEEFAEEYSLLLEADDELICYSLQLQQKSDEESALDEARNMWLRGEEMPDSCTPLFDEAIKQGVISEADIWQRMRLALENNKVTLAKQIIKKLPKAQIFPAAELSVAARNPRRYLSQTKFKDAGKGRHMTALYALQRLSKQSPQIAYAHWQRIAEYFSEDEQRYFFGWLGLAGALFHDERALTWFAAAGDAILNSRQLAWRARAALRAQNWHEVWASIDAMAPDQQSEGAWRYWNARALRVLGRSVEAEELFLELSREFNYYGQLASEELGAEPGAGMSTAGYQPDGDDIEEILSLPAIQRALMLYSMNLRIDGSKEWAWGIRKLNDKQLLAAAELAQRNELYDRSIDAADRTEKLHDFNLRYPAPYRAAMRENVNKHGLDEAWVYGLMRQESRFIVKVKSEAGAAGLMQIMPDTARWVARKIGMKGYRRGLIHQLDVNIKLGTYYMKTVFHQFEDNPALASAAYNAGPTRARQWRGKKPMEGAIYVETIPFNETRHYVRKVLSNTVYYAKLFGQTTQTLKQRLGIIDARNAKNRKINHDIP